jgi:hypothetical protein
VLRPPNPGGGYGGISETWNGEAHDHFYTTDPTASPSGYVDEGVEGYVYPANVPGTDPLLRLYRPDHGFWDDVGDFLSGIADAIWDAISTAAGAIATTFDSILGWALDGAGWLLEHSLFSIPGDSFGTSGTACSARFGVSSDSETSS